MGRGDAGGDEQLRLPLDVEDVAVTAVHVDDDGRDVEVSRRGPLLRVADRHRELELAECADRAAGRIRDLDPTVEVHVGRPEVADRERIAAEVHGLEAVVHH